MFDTAGKRKIRQKITLVLNPSKFGSPEVDKFSQLCA